MSANVLFAALAITLGVFGAVFFTRLIWLACVAVGVPAFVLVVPFFAAAWGYWLPLMVPLVCTCLSIGAAFAYQHQLEGRAGRFLRSAFQFYLSPQLIERIIEDSSALALGGERKELTVFFCDIEGFTKMSESLDPQDLGVFLNEFISAMTKIILDHQGTVDKYIGDAIVAFWNAPVSLTDHASLAVRSALECQKRVVELGRSFKQRFGIELKLRIGLNTGFVSVGNFGSRERFNYTVIGDTVNVASRLEGANKFFGTKILISEQTFEQLPSDIFCRPVGRIRVVGRAESFLVYEPLTDIDPEDLTTWIAVRGLLEAQQLEAARHTLADLPVCRLHSLYLERIADLQASREPWDDTWNLTKK
jgi:adenylate cyclase